MSGEFRWLKGGGRFPSRGVRQGPVLMAPPRSCSEHAIDRFIERWSGARLDDPLARQFAQQTLEQLCQHATHVEDCPGDLDGEGQSIWDLSGLSEPVRVAVTRDGEIRTVFERGAHLRGEVTS